MASAATSDSPFHLNLRRLIFKELIIAAVLKYYTLQYTDLFGALQNLLRSGGSQNGPVTSRTELQAHRESCHQLDP